MDFFAEGKVINASNKIHKITKEISYIALELSK